MALRMNGNFDGAIEDFAVAEKLTPTLSLVIVTLRSLTAILATFESLLRTQLYARSIPALNVGKERLRTHSEISSRLSRQHGRAK
jgi:hypothetical protein